jgi:O-methyltransferase
MHVVEKRMEPAIASAFVADLAMRSHSTEMRERGVNPVKRIFQGIAKYVLGACGYELRMVRLPREEKFNIPDREFYQPLFSPWHAAAFQKYFAIASPRSLVAADACFVLYTLLQQAMHVPGDVWECGVYRGGTAAMMSQGLRDAGSAKKLLLFDTFAGMPESGNPVDTHVAGDFGDVSLESVLEYIGGSDICVAIPGLIPQTFVGLEQAQIAMAHIDVVLYQATLDSIAFIWPRLSAGGFVVFDDYGFGSCPGARAAVDEFFADKTAVPLCLPTGQAIVFKS